MVHLLFVVGDGETVVFRLRGCDADRLGQPSGSGECFLGEFGERAFLQLRGGIGVGGLSGFGHRFEDVGFGDFAEEVVGGGRKPLAHIHVEGSGHRVGVLKSSGGGIVLGLDAVEAEGGAKG